MNRLIFILLLSGFTSALKAQCVFIYASEKIKGVEIPIERREFDVTISDSIKRKLTSFNDGSLGRLSLPAGIYTIKIVNEEFQEGFQSNVIVKESKTTDVVINLVRLGAAAPPKEEGKKKK